MGISVMTTILLAFMNAGEKENENFAYNVEMEGETVTAQWVYRKSDDGQYLSHHLQYNYTYDEEQRLVQKEVLRWDEWSHSWKNSHVFNYTYGLSGYSVEQVKWNETKGEYADLTAKQTYEECVTGAVAVSLFQWNENDHAWVQQEDKLLMNPSLDYLISMQMDML